MAQVVGFVAADGTLSPGSTNIVSASKLAAGRYRYVLKNGWAGPKAVSATPNLLRSSYIYSCDDASVTVEFQTMGSAPAASDVAHSILIFRPV